MLESVSVWDHKPTADELLEKRLREGWKPQCSDLKDGPVILGHAACLVDRHPPEDGGSHD